MVTFRVDGPIAREFTLYSEDKITLDADWYIMTLVVVSGFRSLGLILVVKG